ncbi:MAG: polyphosphate kinase 2 family protein [Planctomycetes bacterium]|jgi:PPK2 family polyphosphate:nucleotide phosphotransferase|nr:polyphosphate kinase 2 family protein [Planctomycetota bacterium]
MAKDLHDLAKKLCSPYRVVEGRKFRLKDIDPAGTGSLSSKERAQALLETGVVHLAEMQDKLYAQDQWALLLIFQAMDAAGKDGTIKHVMSGINPQGCRVYSFKSPSAEELDHDYLWRTSQRAPERGTIGIFNRSYYEEVLVVRVHPEYLKFQKLPERLVTKRLWEERFEDINNFERYLTRNGIAIRKFFLHVSKDEQKKRFLERIELPEKNWKFSLADAKERQRWDDYQRAYEEMIRNTATPWAPWYVVPADHKWFSRIVVASAICEALEEMDLAYPNVGPEKICELGAARASLLNEGPVRRPAAKSSAKKKGSKGT